MGILSPEYSYLYIYMHINIISAAISKWLIIGMWIGEWLILPETVNHRHSWGLSCSWYVHPIKSIFSMKNAPKNDLWAPDPARHGTARREGAMLVARLESWRKANVNRPIHGEAGKKRKNLPPVTLKKWWVVLEYSGTKKSDGCSTVLLLIVLYVCWFLRVFNWF